MSWNNLPPTSLSSLFLTVMAMSNFSLLRPLLCRPLLQLARCPSAGRARATASLLCPQAASVPVSCSRSYATKNAKGQCIGYRFICLLKVVECPGLHTFLSGVILWLMALNHFVLQGLGHHSCATRLPAPLISAPGPMQRRRPKVSM